MLADGTKAVIQDVWTEYLAEPVAVYNFKVDDFHTYFIGESGVLVHNANCTVVQEGERYNKAHVEATTTVNGEVIDVSRDVYQRNDIDWDYIDPKTGLTNKELAQKGSAPYANDGSKMELHHLSQREPGTLVEISANMHDQYSKQLHGLVGNGESFRNDPTLNAQYNNFRSQYWKARAGTSGGN